MEDKKELLMNRLIIVALALLGFTATAYSFPVSGIKVINKAFQANHDGRGNVHLAWLISIRNNNRMTYRVKVHFRLLDEEGAVIRDLTIDDVVIPGESIKSVSHTTVLPRVIWEKVAKHRVEIEEIDSYISI